MYASSSADDDLGRLLDRIPAREVVVLVDSCYSGTMTRSVGRYPSKFYRHASVPRDSQRLSTNGISEGLDSVILLSAAQPEEDARTSASGALFTKGVLRAVREAAQRRFLTLEQLERQTAIFIRQEVGDRRHLAHRPMLTGDPRLRSINLFLPVPQLHVTPRLHVTPQSHVTPQLHVTPQPRVADDPADRFDLWNDLEVLVRDAGEALTVTTSKEVYRVGESLEVSVVAPRDGYIYILNVGDGEDDLLVLYPNAFQLDNRVQRGDTVHIPDVGRFRLPARLPLGRSRQKNLLVAIQTTQPLRLTAESRAEPEAIFRTIRRRELTRSIRRSSLSERTYFAGQVVVTIEL